MLGGVHHARRSTYIMLGGVHQSKTVEVRRSPPNMFRSEKIFHKTYDTYRGLNVRSFAIFEPVPRPRYVEHTARRTRQRLRLKQSCFTRKGSIVLKKR